MRDYDLFRKHIPKAYRNVFYVVSLRMCYVCIWRDVSVKHTFLLDIFLELLATTTVNIIKPWFNILL